jgi:hypothetical protein
MEKNMGKKASRRLARSIQIGRPGVLHGERVGVHQSRVVPGD